MGRNALTMTARMVITSALTNSADGVLRLLLPLMAISAGAAAVEVALIVAAALAPWLLGSLIVGAIVDHWRRSTLVVWANAVRFVTIAVLLGLMVVHTASISSAVLATVAFVCGLAEVFSDLSVQSAVPQVVPDSQLEVVYGRISVVQNVANSLVGPALGGFLYDASASGLTLIVAASYLASVFVVPRTPDNVSSGSFGLSSLLTEVGEGLRVIKKDSWLLRTSASVGAMNFASGASAGVLVTYAVAPGPLMLTSAQYGVLLGIGGVGAVVGGLLSGVIVRRASPRSCIRFGSAALLLSIAAPGLSGDIVVVGAMIFVGNAIGVLFGIQVISTRQRRVPSEKRGRVNAAFQIVGLGSAPLGAVAGAAAVAFIGERAVFTAFAGLAALVVLFTRPWDKSTQESLRT